MEEQWKPIEGYEGYQISNFGRVKSFKRHQRGEILKPSLGKIGYLYINLRKNNETKHFYIHRLVAQAFVPNSFNKPCINHLNGIKTDNRIENLEWVTYGQNLTHAYDKGLRKSKLTSEQVIYIRENHNGLKQNELAELFHVDISLIAAIQTGKAHKNKAGKIRKSSYKRLSDEIRVKIRAEYIRGSRDFGQTALAKKYGVDQSAISRIVNSRSD